MYNILLKIISMMAAVYITTASVEAFYAKRDKFNEYYKKSYRSLFEQGDNEVVIVGASHGSHGINPKYLRISEKKLYNYCINGAGPEFVYDWMVKLYSSVKGKPEMVIYEVDWFMFDSEWLERKFEQDSCFINLSVLLDLVASGKVYAGSAVKNYFTIFKKKQPIVELLLLLNKKPDAYILSIDKYYNGYVPFEYLYSKESLNQKKYRQAKLDNRQYEYFEKLLDYFSESGIRVVFVQTPEYLKGRDDKGAVVYNNMIKTIAMERNIPFLNYNEELVSPINSTPNFYSDWGHLNEAGSTVFTKKLNADLQSLTDSATFQ